MGVVLPGLSFLCLKLRQRSQAAKREKQTGGSWLPVNWTGNRWGVWVSVVSLALAILVEQVETQSLGWGGVQGLGCVSEELLHCWKSLKKSHFSTWVMEKKGL